MPAGVEAGSRLRLQGEGEMGLHGGPNGDLFVVVSIKRHPLFERTGRDIVYELPLTVWQACLGTEVEIPTLEGPVRMKIPAGTQPERVFRLRGRGAPDLNGLGKGDQHVKVRLRIPTKLSERQRELLEELAREGGDTVDTSPSDRGFFEKVRDIFE